jgi:hypothetical protein
MRDKSVPDVAHLRVRPKIKPGQEWEAESKTILKAELARAGISYKELALRLEDIGVADNEKAIGSRISRGKFSFSFFLQCMRALGTESVDLAERRRRP